MPDVRNFPAKAADLNEEPLEDSVLARNFGVDGIDSPLTAEFWHRIDIHRCRRVGGAPTARCATVRDLQECLGSIDQADTFSEEGGARSANVLKPPRLVEQAVECRAEVAVVDTHEVLARVQ